MIPCDAAPLAAAEAARTEPLDGGCLFGDLGVAGRAFAALPEAGVSRGVALPYARGALGLRTATDVQVRLALLAVRSGGDQGYIGVAGESLVPIVEIAEARWDWRATGWMVAAGVVDDPWVAPREADWARRDVVRPLATDQGWLDRADVGGTVSWTAPDAVVTFAAALLTGEGYQRRERNTGTNLTGVVRVRPLREGPIRLELAAMAREGSRGLGQAPDHRLGAGATLRHDLVVVGADALLGWGLLGDGALHPGGASAWGRAGDGAPVVAWARVDLARDAWSAPDANELLVTLGGGPRLPLDGPAYVALGWESRRLGPDAAPIAGSDGLRASDTVFLQIGADVGGAVATR